MRDGRGFGDFTMVNTWKKQVKASIGAGRSVFSV
jgi:hypothetical protein